ncbi:MAG: M20/M25/M40 family metallo-hydrolase [Anaerovoracaceae bacterium]
MEKIARSEVEELLRDLIKIKSPYFEEDKVMDYVLNWFKKNQLNAEMHNYHEAKETNFKGKNVVGILDSGKEGPVIYLGGHLDTVKLCNDWAHEPFEGTIEGDYCYGVGALDMKAGCAAIMLAIKDFVKKTNGEFCGKVIYHFVSDEEGPYGLGTVFIINDQIHNVEEEAEFAIIGEPSAGFTDIPHPCLCLGARGGYNYKIEVSGKSAHAATPQKGVNAVVEASKIICRLEDIELAKDDKLGESASCVIGLTSESGACSVPDRATIEVFHHTVRGETLEKIKENAEKAIREANINGNAEVIFRKPPVDGFDGGFEPYCIDEDNEYLEVLKEAVKAECMKEANVGYFQSIGDFNHIGGKLKIPTVLFGPNGDNFHSHDERVDLKSTTEISNSISNFLVKVLTK